MFGKAQVKADVHASLADVFVGSICACGVFFAPKNLVLELAPGFHGTGGVVHFLGTLFGLGLKDTHWKIMMFFLGGFSHKQPPALLNEAPSTPWRSGSSKRRAWQGFGR